ncbi:extracellular ligand-binding receptor [Catenovulum agarivorans DS-2]|uniref:Extracellular ligand-binding receptor n=1 Tax=Catenovulum agarivorans DS-2 TaxID=1328313 RepID=W7QJ15_9ALTE|nr:ABC transporter substrate-binding protein [Catenovulum agarivorans]EWH08932.1 extracellular ligand-binding receptor [Catenovulum agarivorans DS-2]
MQKFVMGLLGLTFYLSPVNADELFIGLDADLSAVSAEGGIAIQRGAELAIDEINQQGGLLGKSLKLISKDHRGNPARGKRNIEQFAKINNLLAVLGGIHTPVAMTELPVIHKHKVIYLAPWAAGTPIVDNGYSPNYVFRVSLRDQDAAIVLLKHAKQHKLTQVALMLEHTSWGRSNKLSLEQAARALDIHITHIEWFNWRDSELHNKVANALATQPQAMILVSNAPEGAEIVKAMHRLPKSMHKPIISHWGITSGHFVESVGLEILRQADIRVIQTFSFFNAHNQQLAKQVLQQYNQKYQTNYTAHAIPSAVGVAHAYDLVHLLATAVKQAQSTDRAVIRDALEKLPEYHGLVKNYQRAFTPTRHDALTPEDYRMLTFDMLGNLTNIPSSVHAAKLIE